MKLFEKIHSASLPDELPHYELFGGVAINRDGVMEVGAEIQLPSAAMVGSPEGAQRLYRAFHSLLLQAVPDHERLRLILEVTPVRSPLPTRYREETTARNSFLQELIADRAARLEARAQRGGIFQWRLYLTATYSQARVSGRNRRPAYSPEAFAEHFKAVLRYRTELVEYLNSLGITARALESDQEVFEVIWRYLNVGALPATPPTLNTLGERLAIPPPEVRNEGPAIRYPTLAAQLALTEVKSRAEYYIQVGPRYVVPVSYALLPDEVEISHLFRLLNVPGPLYAVLDLRALPLPEGFRQVEQAAQRYASLLMDEQVGHLADAHNRRAYAALRELEEHLAATGDRLVTAGLTVLVVGDTLQDTTRRARGVRNLMQVQRRALVVNGHFHAFQQWMALAPFGGGENEFMNRTSAAGAAAFFPLAEHWKPQAQTLHLLLENRGGELVPIDLFDPRSTNWNGLIVGPSGRGKSFFVHHLVSSFLRDEENTVIIVDKAGSYLPFAQILEQAAREEGREDEVFIANVGPDAPIRFNPFDLDEDDLTEENGQLAPTREKIAFLRALIQTIAPSEGVEAEVEKAVIEAALRQTYTRATTEQRTPDGRYLPVIEPVSLSDFVHTLHTLESIGGRRATEGEQRIAERIATRLQVWVGQGTNAALLDNREGVKVRRARLVYFETSGIPESQRDLLAALILVIAHETERILRRNTAGKKLVIFDEAWAMLKNPAAAGFVEDLYRRIRRYGGAVYAATQRLADISGGLAKAIAANTSYFFLLGLEEGEERLVARELLGLNKIAFQMIHSLATVRGRYAELFFWAKRGDRGEGDVLRYAPAPLERWTYVSHADEVRRREEVARRLGGDLRAAIRALAEGRA